MIKRRRGNKIMNIIYNKKFIALIGFLVIILISIPLSKQISKKYSIDKEIVDLENEINDLEAKNSNLKDFISYLDSDSFIEEQARLNLGLKKEGEEVVVIKKVDLENSVDGAEANNEKSNSNILKWWKYFFVK